MAQPKTTPHRGVRDTRRTPEGPSSRVKSIGSSADSLGPFCLLRPSLLRRGAMPTQTAPVSTAVTFSSEELEMLGDAFAVLFFRAPERRDEIIAFARRRPELQLFYSGPEPELEEDR